MNALLQWFREHDGFALRLAVLVTLMLLFAAIDFALHRQRATRWREYSFLLLMAAFGALSGVSIDLITSSISADYFLVGKGVHDGTNFRLEVMRIGAQAGFVGGCFAAGALMVANAPTDALPALSLRQLAGSCLRILLLALAAACVIGALAAALHLGLPFDAALRLSQEQAPRFNTVWWTHMGVYVGAFLGLLWQIKVVRQARKLINQRPT